MKTSPVIEQLRKVGAGVSVVGGKYEVGLGGDETADECPLIAQEPNVRSVKTFLWDSSARDEHFQVLRNHPGLEEVLLNGKLLTGRVAEFLPTLPKLCVFSLRLADDRDATGACGFLARCPLLVDVSISATTLTDDEVSRLRSLTNLAQLNINGSRMVGSRGLHFISTLKNLTGLDIENTGIDDSIGPVLAECNSLTDLSIGETRFSDAGLKHLESLKNLRRLWVRWTPITADGLASLPLFPNLENLCLDEIRQTDGSVQWLCKLPKLNEVLFQEGDITAAQQRRILKAHPDCYIGITPKNAPRVQRE